MSLEKKGKSEMKHTLTYKAPRKVKSINNYSFVSDDEAMEQRIDEFGNIFLTPFCLGMLTWIFGLLFLGVEAERLLGWKARISHFTNNIDSVFLWAIGVMGVTMVLLSGRYIKRSWQS